MAEVGHHCSQENGIGVSEGVVCNRQVGTVCNKTKSQTEKRAEAFPL